MNSKRTRQGSRDGIWKIRQVYKDHRPKGDDGDYSPSSDDERWEREKGSRKPGIMILLSLGGFLFHYLEVKHKL